jgi:hypothetical protein
MGVQFSNTFLPTGFRSFRLSGYEGRVNKIKKNSGGGGYNSEHGGGLLTGDS